MFSKSRNSNCECIFSFRVCENIYRQHYCDSNSMFLLVNKNYRRRFNFVSYCLYLAMEINN